jgi:hypothetical protein
MILSGITARFMGYSHSPRRSANDTNWPRHPIGAILPFAPNSGERFVPVGTARPHSSFSFQSEDVMIESKREMNANEIPSFVAEVIAAGCDINAVGHDMYVLGDVDEQQKAKEELSRIGERYGDRAALRSEIIAYLRSIGRFVDVTWPQTIH